MTATLAVAPHFRSLQPRREQYDVERGDCWDLVEAAQQGDSEAYGQLYARYYDSVFRFVFYRIADRSDAEDFTSETFLRALGKIESVRYVGRDVGAWFVTIARHLILDHVKSSRYRLETTCAEILDSAAWPDTVNMRTLGAASQTRKAVLAFVQNESDPADAATADLYRVMLRADLAHCRAMLTPEQQRVITLRFDQDLSVSATAAAMGSNIGAVKALQYRALRRLGQLMPERSVEGARLD